jgi:hypothetical protein
LVIKWIEPTALHEGEMLGCWFLFWGSVHPPIKRLFFYAVRHERLVKRNDKKNLKCRRHERNRGTLPTALNKHGGLVFYQSFAPMELSTLKRITQQFLFCQNDSSHFAAN